MQFKLVPNPTFTTIVNLSVPEKTGTASVEFTFNYKNRDQFDAWFKANKSKPTAEALTEVVVNWGVLGPDDLPIEVNKANMIELLKNYPAAGIEIFTAYHNALREARAKN